MRIRYLLLIGCCLWPATNADAASSADTTVVGADSTADSFYLVVGSYSTLTAAKEVLTILRLRLADPLQIGSTESTSTLFYRILAGPFEAHTPLDDIQARTIAAGVEGAWKIPASGMVLMSEDTPDPRTAQPVDVSSAAQPAARVEPLPPDDIPQGDDSIQSEMVEIASEEITLFEAVHLAVTQNLELRASEQALLADEAQVRKAKSTLLPNVEIGVIQTALDRDRAEASLGRAPEYRSSATVRIRQVVYSDAARATYQIQKILQQARSHDQQGRVLDTILTASTAYLSLLRAESMVSIIGDDLKLTDSNYERAKIRLDLGVANKAEVYRWQTRQASARRALVLAEAAVRKARINLNLIINRPLGSQFRTRKPSLQDPDFLITGDTVWDGVQLAGNREKLRDYWVSEALANVPQLRSLSNQRQAQSRALLAATRSLKLPTVGLSVDAVKHMSEAGAGTEQLDFTFPGFETKIGGTTDQLEWVAALTATIPLYAGGERYAEVRKSRVELDRLDLLYDEALRKVEASVLSNLADFDASLTNISFAEDAATASKNNLDLITDSYARGVVTIIDLLDAQISSLSAELSSANAVYDFIGDYLRLQRSVGRFDITLTEEQKQQALARLSSILSNE